MSADAFALPPVFICDKCGQGFLTAQPHGIHQYPVWKMLSSPIEGPICGGQINAHLRPEPENSTHVLPRDPQKEG